MHKYAKQGLWVGLNFSVSVFYLKSMFRITSNFRVCDMKFRVKSWYPDTNTNTNLVPAIPNYGPQCICQLCPTSWMCPWTVTANHHRQITSKLCLCGCSCQAMLLPPGRKGITCFKNYRTTSTSTGLLVKLRKISGYKDLGTCVSLNSGVEYELSPMLGPVQNQILYSRVGRSVQGHLDLRHFWVPQKWYFLC